MASTIVDPDRSPQTRRQPPTRRLLVGAAALLLVGFLVGVAVTTPFAADRWTTECTAIRAAWTPWIEDFYALPERVDEALGGVQYLDSSRLGEAVAVLRRGTEEGTLILDTIADFPECFTAAESEAISRFQLLLEDHHELVESVRWLPR